jgi:hypothetical protein
MNPMNYDGQNFRVDRFRREAEAHRLARAARPLPRRSGLVRRLSQALASR